MIELKTKREIQLIQEAGTVLKKVFSAVKPMIVPGVTTDALDSAAERVIRENGGEPAFKGYRGFPKTACVSLNEAVVHGIPGQDVGAPAALPVDVCLAGGVPVGNLTGVTLGQHEALTRRAGEHRISAVTGSLLHPASQFTASRNADTARFAYAVGSRENRTLALVVEAIPVP
jgi:methionine aminopeptidase